MLDYPFARAEATPGVESRWFRYSRSIISTETQRFHFRLLTTGPERRAVISAVLFSFVRFNTTGVRLH